MFPIENDTYLRIIAAGTAQYRVKGSLFMGFAQAVDSEDDIKQILNQIKKDYPKATHYCYAFRLGLDKHHYRANDDGEPLGSAGRPILNQIDAFGLQNALVVVLRYYGGQKLGISGLREAYKISSQLSLEQAEIQTTIAYQNLYLQTSYTQLPNLMNWLKMQDIGIKNLDYQADKIELEIAIRLKELLRLGQNLQEMPELKLSFKAN